MGGFQFNGCGAKDYFSKVKYLGEHMCPNCKKIAPFYLEKGSFKVSVFWVPTVTLKQRYAIMCENCKEGKWIEDAEAYKILNGNTYMPNELVTNITEASFSKCPQCGADIDGAFCGKCGAQFEQREDSTGTTYVENSISVSVKKGICSNCGSEVDGAFCSKCGTKYLEPAVNKSEHSKICSKCGAEVDGNFCGICGTKYILTEDTTIPVKEQPKPKCSKCGAEVDGNFCGKCGAEHQKSSDPPSETDNQSKGKTVPQEWECSLCGTKNPQDLSKCSLCGCEK